MEIAEEVRATDIARESLYEKFKDRFTRDPFLTRKIVSFQANKKSPIYRWFKYKEGFSADLVRYYVDKFDMKGKEVLDPFAGIGTTLFASSELGCSSTGIELLPVGKFYMDVRRSLDHVDPRKLMEIHSSLWSNIDTQKPIELLFDEVPITNGAFPEETELYIAKYLGFAKTLDDHYSQILKFILFSCLEPISFTRKDGQYLRWDHRSNRVKGNFDKGEILDFRKAIDGKFREVVGDIESLTADPQTLFNRNDEKGDITIFQDSCLNKLTEFHDETFDLVVTSPPYCNRYDYTRTYALELVYLGCDNEEIKKLRQQMLSCTVENKSKVEELKAFYSERNKADHFIQIMNAYNTPAMEEVNAILEDLRSRKLLNNSGIARMVKNYFLEMCITIFELSRVMKKGGRVVMVNDNVRYNGEEIPVDLILSEFAEQFGLETEDIFVLDQNKGNSSQQMGSHGRHPLRKCTYSWIKK